MTALTKLHDAIRPDVVLVCVENTNAPCRAGRTLVVTGDPLPDGGVPCVTRDDGEPATFHIPIRRRGVHWLDERTVRWPLAKTGRLAAHTVTYRIEDPA